MSPSLHPVFFRLNKCSSYSISLSIVLHLPAVLVDLHWTCPNMSMAFLHWAGQHWMCYSSSSPTRDKEREGLPLHDPLPLFLLIQASMQSVTFVRRAHCWLLVPLCYLPGRQSTSVLSIRTLGRFLQSCFAGCKTSPRPVLVHEAGHCIGLC